MHASQFSKPRDIKKHDTSKKSILINLTAFTVVSVGPTSVTLERTSSAGELEVGSTVSYTCTSTGGYPTPTLRLLVGGSEVSSATGPSMSKGVITTSGMHNNEVKCEAFNDHGTVEDMETLTLFRNWDFPLGKQVST